MNSKVIVARSYVLPELGYEEQENQSAEDEDGHGTSVSGIAAGRLVESAQGMIRGIAPRAFLGNYKVFGTPGINSFAPSAGIIAAIEDAVLDEMDVLNLSLGGPPDEPGTELEVEAIRLATEAGVLSVIAAGNSGPASNTIEAPGISPDALTVGSISHSRIDSPFLSVSSDVAAVPFDLQSFLYLPAAPVPKQVGPFSITALSGVDPDEEACQELPAGSLADQVAVVRVGNCSFQDQADHVFAAGANGLVISVASESLPETSLESSGPVAMIGQRDGSLLRDLLENQAEVSITFGAETDLLAFPDPMTNDLSFFSSRGPSIDLLIKPDLLAPGESVLTAARQFEPVPGFSNCSGTSASTPFVAGAAAVLKQLHPGWGPRAMKSALINTASPDVLEDAEVPRIMQTGNGKLDLAAAVSVLLTADPVSLSFGFLTETEGFERSHSIQLSNQAIGAQACQVAILESLINSSVDLMTSSADFSLEDGENLELVVTAASSQDPRPGPFEGRLWINCGDETASLTLPYWGVVAIPGPALLQVRQDGSADFSSLETAFEAAQPGNIIGIEDSETYAINLDISQTIDGVRLDGLTLRAGEDASPTIEAGGSAPAISVSEVEDVLIEGLHIRGGRSGVSFFDATGVVRDNLIEETRSTSDSHGVDIRYSGVHVYDNVIRDNGRAGVFVMDAGAIVQGTEITGNGAGGVVSDGGIVSVFDNFISDNTLNVDAQEVRLVYSLGLVKGNEIRDSGGPLGDGIQAMSPITQAWIQDNWIAGNRRNGVALFDGATVGLLRNEIRENQKAGLHLEGESVAELFSSKLLRNGIGIEVADSELFLQDSVVAHSTTKGDGSGLVLRGGIVEGYNASFFSNAGFGLDLEGDATIANSVFFENLSGDLGSFPPGSVLNSLIGDGQLDGIDDNFAGDPLLNDPAGADFSLKPGSPAIDRGSDSFPAGAADLDGHLRVVDGDLNGTEVIDLGAVEFGSEFAPALVVPIISEAGLDFAGLAVTNTFHETTRVKVRTYAGAGSPAGVVDELEMEMEPLTQFLVLVEGLPGGVTEGWLEVLSTQPDSVALTLAGDQQLRMIDGVALGQPLSLPIWFPEIHSGDSKKTWLYLINPGDEMVEVALTWHGPEGEDIARGFSIGPKGMVRDTVTALFGAKSDLEGGYVSAQVAESVAGASNPELFGLQLFGTGDSLAALPALAGGTADQLVLPHLYLGAGLLNHLSVINTGPAREIQLELMDSRGDLVGVSQSNLESGGFLQVDLAQLFQVGSDVDGWLRLSPGIDLVASHVVESETGSFLAALPLQSAGAREVVIGPAAKTEDFFTGLGLLNDSPFGVLSTIELFDPVGQLLGTHFLSLAPGEKQSHVLFELLSIVREQPGGFVRIRSTFPIYTVGSLGAQRLNFLTLLFPHVLVK